MENNLRKPARFLSVTAAGAFIMSQMRVHFLLDRAVAMVRSLVGDPELTLRARYIGGELTTPAFPIARIVPEPEFRQRWFDRINDWQAKDEMHLPWHPDPAISEGKSRAEMIQSLLNEPIRKPIDLAICPCIGFAFVYISGCNRLCAARLRGLLTVPAVATLLLCPTGSDPGDEAVAATWRLMTEAAAEFTCPPGRAAGEARA